MRTAILLTWLSSYFSVVVIGSLAGPPGDGLVALVPLAPLFLMIYGLMFVMRRLRIVENGTFRRTLVSPLSMPQTRSEPPWRRNVRR